MDGRPRAESVERCSPHWLWALLATPAVAMAFTFLMPLFPPSPPIACPTGGLEGVRLIHVRSLHGGTEAWRPAAARELAPMIYEVLAVANQDSMDGELEFVPGTVVRCEERMLSGERCHVAVARTDPPASELRATGR